MAQNRYMCEEWYKTGEATKIVESDVHFQRQSCCMILCGYPKIIVSDNDIKKIENWLSDATKLLRVLTISQNGKKCDNLMS